jgi:hypothetical protein
VVLVGSFQFTGNWGGRFFSHRELQGSTSCPFIRGDGATGSIITVRRFDKMSNQV